MRSYSRSIFSRVEQRLLTLAEEVVRLLPETNEEGGVIRCHEIARVVAECARRAAGKPVLWVQDGLYGFVDHTWLWTSEPRSHVDCLDCPNILDPYCVGSLPQVRLADCSHTVVPHFGLMYQLGALREDVQATWIYRQVLRIMQFVSDDVQSGLSA